MIYHNYYDDNICIITGCVLLDWLPVKWNEDVQQMPFEILISQLFW